MNFINQCKFIKTFILKIFETRQRELAVINVIKSVSSLNFLHHFLYFLFLVTPGGIQWCVSHLRYQITIFGGGALVMKARLTGAHNLGTTIILIYYYIYRETRYYIFNFVLRVTLKLYNTPIYLVIENNILKTTNRFVWVKD